jgi:Spy/CpxP family protein refolding chaperone
MKKAMLSSLVAMGLLLTAGTFLSSAVAQDQSGSSAPAKMQPPSPDEVVDTLAAKLNLSDDQKTQIKPIIADRQQKLQTLRSDTSMRPMQKMRKMKGIFDDSDKKIEAVLNDQQKQQYIQMEQQMRQEMRERMQNRGASGGSNPQ